MLNLCEIIEGMSMLETASAISFMHSGTVKFH